MEHPMKARELLTFESPYDLGSAPPSFKQDVMEISDSTLQREFLHLGDLDLDERAFSFWLRKTEAVAYVTVGPVERNGRRYHQVVTEVWFENRYVLDVPRQLQVRKTNTNKNYTGLGLAMAMYIVLARYGYSVVSDYEQFTGGINLWKKISRESKDRKYVVKVWNDRVEDWVRGSSGKPLHFDSTNIDDSVIWNLEKSEPTSVLVLTSR